MPEDVNYKAVSPGRNDPNGRTCILNTALNNLLELCLGCFN